MIVLKQIIPLLLAVALSGCFSTRTIEPPAPEMVDDVDVRPNAIAKVQIAEAFGREENGELWLVGMHVPPYARSGGDSMSHDPDRPRKLLLHRSEIRRIVERMNLEGLTLVPLKLYFKSGNAKVEVALARGRKLHDKRQALARKEADREADRAMGAVRRS